jgi:pSer/pThr/pTyr-binding forkhead associated (FHA) protein
MIDLNCNQQVYIKDVKSSNGTFVNGERLSNECEESEPKELNNQDEIEFGIDIINDNGSGKNKFEKRN